MGTTLRKISTERGERFVIRTRYTYEPDFAVTETDVARIANSQRKSFDVRFPHLANIPFEYNWAGRLCLSSNHVPAFGEVDEGLYSACCCNGLGTVKSTLAGVLAAELATGVRSEILDRYQAQPKPSPLPPAPIAYLGINSIIRWQQFRAGQEG
jgi:glycine/D-amino acid oxidase-like deaminating enzyme